MYGWLWRHLPGRWPVKVVCALALLAAVLAVVFVWVFPWIEPRLPFSDVTVEDGEGSVVGSSPSLSSS